MHPYLITNSIWAHWTNFEKMIYMENIEHLRILCEVENLEFRAICGYFSSSQVLKVLYFGFHFTEQVYFQLISYGIMCRQCRCSCRWFHVMCLRTHTVFVYPDLERVKILTGRLPALSFLMPTPTIGALWPLRDSLTIRVERGAWFRYQLFSQAPSLFLRTYSFMKRLIVSTAYSSLLIFQTIRDMLNMGYFSCFYYSCFVVLQVNVCCNLS